jgi:hypothetical protein
MDENTQLYQVGLSSLGGLIVGALAFVTGLVWKNALGIKSPSFPWKVAGAGALWGMTVVQLTPTGGVIMENRTTVNYAVVALHCWMAALSSILGLVVWLSRVQVSKLTRDEE